MDALQLQQDLQAAYELSTSHSSMKEMCLASPLPHSSSLTCKFDTRSVEHASPIKLVERQVTRITDNETTRYISQDAIRSMIEEVATDIRREQRRRRHGDHTTERITGGGGGEHRPAQVRASVRGERTGGSGHRGGRHAPQASIEARGMSRPSMEAHSRLSAQRSDAPKGSLPPRLCNPAASQAASRERARRPATHDPQTRWPSNGARGEEEADEPIVPSHSKVRHEVPNEVPHDAVRPAGEQAAVGTDDGPGVWAERAPRQAHPASRPLQGASQVFEAKERRDRKRSDLERQLGLPGSADASRTPAPDRLPITPAIASAPGREPMPRLGPRPTKQVAPEAVAETTTLSAIYAEIDAEIGGERTAWQVAPLRSDVRSSQRLGHAPSPFATPRLRPRVRMRVKRGSPNTADLEA